MMGKKEKQKMDIETKYRRAMAALSYACHTLSESDSEYTGMGEKNTMNEIFLLIDSNPRLFEKKQEDNE